MATSRIYYTDPDCLEFESHVRHVTVRDGRPAAVLAQTAFYPTSGGQPFDTGRLGASAVLDVVDEGDEVLHLLDAPLEEGQRVKGIVDAARRFDHRQQHTGQHVLSAAFERLFQNRTTSFHMGRDVSTIDLANEVRPESLAAAVADANRVVWENRPVSIRFVSASEAAQLPLRKEPVRGGTLRLIEVEDYDLSACGGTHVSRTGAIGLIASSGVEKVRGGSRVSFVCGGRALRTLDTLRDAVAASIRSLSVLPHELPSAIERLQSEARALRRDQARLQEQLAAFQAARLLEQAERAGDVAVVMTTLAQGTAATVKLTAAAVARAAPAVAVVVTDAPPVSVAVCASIGSGVDAGAVLRTLTTRFGGRGGGKADMAQGGGLDGSPSQVLDLARAFVVAALRTPH